MTRKPAALIISPSLNQGRLNANARDLLGQPSYITISLRDNGNTVVIKPAKAFDKDAYYVDPRTGNISTNWAKRACWEAGARYAYPVRSGIAFMKQIQDAHFFESKSVTP